MRSGVLAVFLLASATILPAIPATAQVAASDTMQVAPSSLRNGQWAWYEEPQLIKASTNDWDPVSIVVSIPDQRAYVYRGGHLVGASTVSTGSDGHETPVGAFTILQKKVFHRSNLYSNAPMPFMQRLTWDGIALHAGRLPGYPASHGCIRFPAAFAKQLYALTELGGDVMVTDEPVLDPVRAVPPTPLLMADARNLGGEAFNMVTMPGTAPRLRIQPASWTTGPTREIVQPLPRRGSK
ncbi:L,D-transpeptidase family protein [Sphingomonas sp. Sphisp140]|uniref:L,D-transpeptidase family protein n=1 Tax=unclassified Sphingomonas TaxID=196159 RepID=UPI0039B11997